MRFAGERFPGRAAQPAVVFPVMLAALFAVLPLFVFAEGAGGAFDPFGGFDDEGAALSGAGGNGITVGGAVTAGLTGYIKDIADNAGNVQAGDIVKGSLTFSAKGDSAEAFVKVNLQPVFGGSADGQNGGQKPAVTLDEAFLSVFFGALTVDAGLRRLTWGKADNEGPLDVINPLDYADLSDIKPGEPPKIARPLVRAVFRFGDYSKIEGVFVPWFSGQVFADGGRWEPAQAKALKQMAALFGVSDIDAMKADTVTLSWFQAGARFSTTVSHSDIGVQYYTGYLPRPAYAVETGPVPAITLGYNRYHQIGMDCAAEAAGFNMRAEAAVNISGDLSGDDPSVYNPHFLWSFGFDRSLFAGISLNLQCNQKIRLADDGVGKKPYDVEADTPVTATRGTAELSRAFFRDTVRLSAAAVWGIEDKDLYLIPAVTFTHGSAELELSGGFFLGDRNGELGQYRDNSFVKAVMKYGF
ncbi:MAG: hypothetical protein LBL31_03970 [Spirochaetaceae bacterium]|jgi:hypothetical protein|nr:hypothetical protein [Spirochaetaceae bacterium]